MDSRSSYSIMDYSIMGYIAFRVFCPVGGAAPHKEGVTSRYHEGNIEIMEKKRETTRV